MLLRRRTFGLGIPVRRESRIRKMAIKIKTTQRENGTLSLFGGYRSSYIILPASAMRLGKRDTTLLHLLTINSRLKSRRLPRTMIGLKDLSYRNAQNMHPRPLATSTADHHKCRLDLIANRRSGSERWRSSGGRDVRWRAVRHLVQCMAGWKMGMEIYSTRRKWKKHAGEEREGNRYTGMRGNLGVLDRQGGGKSVYDTTRLQRLFPFQKTQHLRPSVCTGRHGSEV